MSALLVSAVVWLMCSIPAEARIRHRTRHHYHSSGSGTVVKLTPEQSKIALIIGIAFIALVALLMIVSYIKKKKSAKKNSPPGTAVATMVSSELKDYTDEITQEILKHDNYFSTVHFFDHSQEVLNKVLRAASAGDFTVLQQTESAELFKKHYQEIKNLQNAGKTERFEEIQTDQFKLTEYKLNQKNEELSVCVSGTMRNYITDSSGAPIEGSQAQMVNFRYGMTFKRNISTSASYDTAQWVLKDFVRLENGDSYKNSGVILS